MVSMSKEEILEAIKQSAQKNGGRPLGFRSLEKETGITPYQWGKYWAKFTDAQIEAGFEPNSPTPAFEAGYVEKKFIELIRKLGKFPTLGEIRVERLSNPDLPKIPTKKIPTILELARRLHGYTKDKDEYNDIALICTSKIENITIDEEEGSEKTALPFGEVYLYKSGQYYKIGKTNNLIRRGRELKLLLPDEPIPVHSIKTDDPAGVEAYWHKRFEGKRKGNSEFFVLTANDVKSFKRWKRIH